MSLQDIRDGLFYTFHTWGPFAASELSTCAFDVLEGANTCAIVFLPSDSEFEPLTFGASSADYKHWGIGGSGYIKDTGDPKNLLSRVWQMHDDIYDTIRKDRTLNRTAAMGHIVSMTYDPNVGIDAGGAFWAEVKWRLIADSFE